MTIRADDNWFQRAYFGWAVQHYERMPPRMRSEVERIDRWLYSRRGTVVWLCLAMALVATVLGLRAAGATLTLAVVGGLVVWSSLPGVVLSAWLQPERFVGRKAVKIGILTSLGLFAGAAFGFVVGHVVKHRGFDPVVFWPALKDAVVEGAPFLALAALGLGAVMELAAFARRRVLRVELERATLVGERDTAAREAAEARLRLLQGQIRPHFVFNTLASLQHWVDTGDARAGPLLRSLTAFLRGTTDAMDAPFARLADECEAARHYLAIMAARLGPRLAWSVEVAGDAAGVELPTGLVLTLVENAVEHGVEPTLGGGTIEVSALREGSSVVLRVVDDGAGLRAAAPAARESTRGVGIENSRARLRHRYGGAATLELVVGPGGRGAEARVRIEVAP